MKFRPPRRKNPFDGFFPGLLTHAAASAAMIIGLYTAMAERTLVPLYLAGVFISLLEGVWLYFFLRR